MKMKRLRKALSVLLVAVLVVGLLPVQSNPVIPAQAATTQADADSTTIFASGTCGENITWTLTEDTDYVWDNSTSIVGPHYKLTLTGSGDMPDYYNSYSMPWYSYRGYITSVSVEGEVTSIGAYAFSNCASLVKVTMSNKVTKIGNYAFYANRLLKTITFSTGLKEIGNDAFESCNNSLKEIDLSKCTKLTTIGSSAFDSCSQLRTVKLPNSVTSLGNYAFYYCYYLESINIPTNLTELQPNTFYYCLSLSTVTIPTTSKLTKIGASCFYNCSNLGSITIPNTVTELGASCFYYCTSLSTVKLSSKLTTMGASCFENCSSLGSITLPSTLTTMEASCFENAGLTSITIPAKVTTIGSKCFYNNKLTEIKTANNTKFSAKDNVLYQKDGTNYTAIAYARGSAATTLTLQNNTIRIESYTFYNSSLNSISLPNSLTTIGSYAFKSSSISSVQYADIAQSNLQTIESSAFSNCSNLKSIEFPDSLQTIQSSAFSSTGLQSINTNNVQMITSGAFGSCGSLTTVTIGKELKGTDGSVFNGSSNLGTITVTEENPYLTSVDNVVFNKDKTQICFYAFAKTNATYEVPDTVTAINGYSIYRALALEELYVPSNINTIASYGIYNNAKLNSVYFKGDVNTIASSGISNNTKLNSIYFTGNAPAISTSIINNKNNLLIFKTETSTGWDDAKWLSYEFADYYPDNTETDEGVIDNKIKWTYEGADGSVKLECTAEDNTNTRLPDFVGDSPAPWAKYMDKIQTVEAEGIEGIGDYNFQGAKKLIRLEADEALLKIGAYGFENCEKLLFIDISYAEEIGEAAFKNNARITGAGVGYLKLDKVQTIGAEAFRGCSTIAKATLGSQLTSLEEGVFADCTKLSQFTIPSSVTAIKKEAMSGCSELVDINIPAAVKSIGQHAFANNEKLEKVSFAGDAPESTQWADDSFENCNEKLTFYFDKDYTTWNPLGTKWNEIPLVGIGKYKEKRDHYSFANTRSSFGYAQDYRMPRQRYVDVIGNIISGTYYYSVNRRWNGSCYGMASTTLEFYENMNKNPLFEIAKYGENVETLYGLSAPGNPNAALTKVIEAYQLSQYKSFMSGCGRTISKHMRDYAGLYNRVRNFQMYGGLAVDANAEPVVLLIYTKFSGHAVIPISVDQDTRGNFAYKVYDPNIPNEVQTITIMDNGTMNYQPSYTSIPFTYASYIGYTEIAQNMSDVQLHGVEEDQSIYLSIDKENGAVTNAAGDGIDKMQGAYEQKLFNSENLDEFSGIRSFVLPKGADYQISSKKTEDTEDNATKNEGTDESTKETSDQSVTFYMASNENFAEVNSSDESAMLKVNNSDKEDGTMEMALQSESTEEENAVITLMNSRGMERTVEVEGSNATITTEADNDITVQVPSDKEVVIDGHKVEVVDGKAVISFEAAQGENPLVENDLETTITCNEKNMLKGSVNASVISRVENEKEVTVTATYFDQNDTKVAAYSEKMFLASGLNFVSLSFDELQADFGGMNFEEIGSELKLSCLLTISDNENHFVSSIVSGLSVSPTIVQEPENQDPGTEDIAVTKIETTKQALTLNVGDNYQIVASVLPSNATNKSLTYEASNENIVVDSNGKVTAKKAGDSEITITASNGVKTVVAVTVKEDSGSQTPPESDKDIEVTGVETAKQSLTLNVGADYQLMVNVLPSNATNRTVKFEASNDNVVVDDKGKVTAKKAGESQVTITASNGIKAVVTITVKDNTIPPQEIAVTSVETEKKALTLNVGDAYQVIASVLPANATNKTLIFTASNDNIVVDSKGKVTAKKAGTSQVTITASNGISTSVAVTVKEEPKKLPQNVNQNTVKKDIAVSSVKVTKKKIVLGKGEAYQVRASVVPQNATNKKLIYKASDKKVSVNAKGLIKAKKTGTSKVTITASNGRKSVITVVVKKAPKKLTIKPKKKTLKVGKSYKIKVQLPKNTASQKITYSSNKKSVAKVSSTGKVTARKKGTATITVKTFNKKKATIKIIVK